MPQTVTHRSEIEETARPRARVWARALIGAREQAELLAPAKTALEAHQSRHGGDPVAVDNDALRETPPQPASKGLPTNTLTPGAATRAIAAPAANRRALPLR